MMNIIQTPFLKGLYNISWGNVKPFKQKLSYQGKEHQRLIIHRKKAHIFIKASHNNTVIMPITSKICIRDAIQQYYKVLF